MAPFHYSFEAIDKNVSSFSKNRFHQKQYPLNKKSSSSSGDESSLSYSVASGESTNENNASFAAVYRSVLPEDQSQTMKCSAVDSLAYSTDAESYRQEIFPNADTDDGSGLHGTHFLLSTGPNSDDKHALELQQQRQLQHEIPTLEDEAVTDRFIYSPAALHNTYMTSGNLLMGKQRQTSRESNCKPPPMSPIQLQNDNDDDDEVWYTKWWMHCSVMDPLQFLAGKRK